MADALTEFEDRYPEYPQAARAMLAALAETVSPLIILGDHIGNTFAGGNGQPAFDRCAIINQVLTAIKAAEAVGITTGEDDD